MYESRLVSGLAVVLAGTAVLFVGFAVVYNPIFLAVASVFGASAYFVWYHASGRFARRVYRGVENQAAADPERDSAAGPREEWEAPRDGRRTRSQSRERARGNQSSPSGSADRGTAGTTGGFGGRGGSSRRTGQRRRARRSAPQTAGGLTTREAYETLGLDPDADAAAVRDAYRERVKEVHPDRPDGDEEAFKRVNAAYERLNGD